MEEILFYLQKYDEILIRAAVIAISLIVLIYLARILRQIKRLNKNLGNITGNMQAYFDVILKEEPELESEPVAESKLSSTLEVKKETETKAETVQAQITKEETEESLLEQERKKIEDEKLFHTVLQEYFS